MLHLGFSISLIKASMSPFAAAAINGVFLKKSQALISENGNKALKTYLFLPKIETIKGESPF
jgi:hypothetical protein